MNREEAKGLFRNDKNSYGGVKSPMTKIDKIYDDFEREINKLTAQKLDILKELKDYFMYEEDKRDNTVKQSRVKWDLYLKSFG